MMSLRSKRSASIVEADRMGEAMSKIVRLGMFCLVLAFALVPAA
jgi:hypothetical protein